MDSLFKLIKVSHDGPIGSIQLNNPKRLNAISNEVLKELIKASDWFNQQTSIRVVVISGTGKAFSAGADLRDAMVSNKNLSWIERRNLGQLGYNMTHAIENMKAITIAQVQGFAIGGAFLLMLACDFRIASTASFFSIPEVDLGIPLAWGGIPKLVGEIGPTKTKELVMTCRRFDAQEASALGILNKVVSQKELAAHCQALAKELAQKPIIPLIITKEQVNTVVKNIGNGFVASSEGDMLQSIQKDPEAKVAAMNYVEKNLKK